MPPLVRLLEVVGHTTPGRVKRGRESFVSYLLVCVQILGDLGLDFHSPLGFGVLPLHLVIHDRAIRQDILSIHRESVVVERHLIYRLSESVSEVELRWRPGGDQLLRSLAPSTKEELDVNVLRPFVEPVVLDQVQCSLVIAEHERRCR